MVGAIVHEWIEPSGGAEKVLDAMVNAFPDSDIFALWNDAPDRYPANTVYESWLARSPLRKHKALALPLLPATWRRLAAPRDYEWMLISSHLFAHHARFRGAAHSTPKFVYAHTPARYIWSPEMDARGSSVPIRAAAAALKPLDRGRAQEPVAIAANSEFVRQRIQKAWNRDATVIYPPVDVERIRAVVDWRAELPDAGLALLESLPKEFILGASRFIPYKRLDLVIEAGQAAKLPVVIAGRGPEEERLRALAATMSVPVHFVISPPDALLYALYQKALAYVFPAIEDFGIMPVEAIAAGCPVVCLSLGGAAESVVPGTSGVVVERADAATLAQAIALAALLPRESLPSAVERFSAARFAHSLEEWMGEQ